MENRVRQQNSGGNATNVVMFEVRKYKEEDFVIPASDTKGHSERIFYRIQPGLMRDLKIILASGKFPFRTVGDIGRMCTKLGVDELMKMEGIASVRGQVDAIIKIVRDEEYHQEFINTFDEIAKAVNRYMTSGEELRARKVLAEIRGQIQSMPDGYWKEKYIDEMRNRYGHLLAKTTELIKESHNDDE